MSSAPRFYKPHHVSATRAVQIDKPLLEALVLIWRDPTPVSWSQVFESVLSYNYANTDSSTLPAHFEIISLVSAFQRLLDTGSRARDLRTEFSRIFIPNTDLSKTDSQCGRLATSETASRIQTTSFGNTVRDGWLQDFCNLRGKVAHGKIESPYAPIWSIRNHLLLASYAFPLLLKCYLEGHGVYSLTDDDRFDIDVFEQLACEEHFAEVSDGRHPWNDVRRRAWWNKRFPGFEESELG